MTTEPGVTVRLTAPVVTPASAASDGDGGNDGGNDGGGVEVEPLEEIEVEVSPMTALPPPVSVADRAACGLRREGGKRPSIAAF